MKLLIIQLSDMHFENTNQTHSIYIGECPKVCVNLQTDVR